VTTITVTAEPATASVDVVVSGVDPTVRTLTILRTGIDGSRVPLRGSPFAVAGGTVVAVDSEAPFGVPVRYALESDPTVTAVARLDIDVPWLTHPLSPFLSVPCVVDDDAEWTYPGRTYTYDVIDRAEPVYTWYRRSTRSGTVSVSYETTAQRSAIVEVLETGAPLLVRYPASYEQFPSVYIGTAEARVVPRGVGSRAGQVQIDYVVVSAPPSSVASPSAIWKWEDVPPVFPTWADLVAGIGTWTDAYLYNPAPTSPLPAPGPPPLGT
jgi:hypothetical protein